MKKFPFAPKILQSYREEKEKSQVSPCALYSLNYFSLLQIIFIRPPKKVFSSQEDYLARNIHDDLLELLPESTNETVKVKKLTSLNPRLKIIDRLYDKGNWVRDAKTSQTRLSLIKKWFLKRNLFAPHANI